MKKLVVSISHTNYCIRSAGTEKFIRELSRNLKNNGYSHLNIFSFYNNKGAKKLIGVNYNDTFIGIFDYSDLIKVIKLISYKTSSKIVAIHIQHLLNHRIEDVENIIVELKVPVYIMLHDYYIMCPEVKLISPNFGFCGVSAPSEEKCGQCAYGNKAYIHYLKMKKFLNKINPWIKNIIAPSAYVEKEIKKIFSEFASKIIVRSHLIYEAGEMQTKIEGKINIAFAGAPLEAKGYNEWKQISKILDNTNYRKYYLGSGKQEQEDVANIYVSNAIQGEDAMKKALKQNNIHCAFLWPNWPETYSYVLYELIESGVYIITNDISGNICDVVDREKNGVVFHSLEECKMFLQDSEKVRKEINAYREHGKFHIKNVHQNLSLKDLIDESFEGKIIYDKVKVKKQCIQTFLYRLKYRAVLKNKKEGKLN